MRGRAITLAARPEGMPVPQDFALRELPVRPLRDGEILLRNRLFTIDPASRNFMDDRPGYRAPLPLGGVMRATVIGEVLQSRNDRYAVGDLVRAYAGWEEFSVVDDDNITIERLDPHPDIPLASYLGALGWSGITAYVGLHHIAGIGPGETVVVSAGAGAVGSVVGQIARLRGCRAVGVVGTSAKARLAADAFGYDAVIARREVPDLATALALALPDGADIYFDNVGGETLDAMLPLMRESGRIPVCGMVAIYNERGEGVPIRNLWQVLVKRLTMRGFLGYEHKARRAEAQRQLETWVLDGALTPVENVAEGLEQAPAAFVRMLSGDTVGKTLVSLPG